MRVLPLSVHRHPCPGCGLVWTHRIASNICRAYNGEPLRCGLCQLQDQMPTAGDRRWEWLAWVAALLAVLGQTVVIVWALS